MIAWGATDVFESLDPPPTPTRENAAAAPRALLTGTFFKDSQWANLADWETELAPHYAEAQRMLGVVIHDHDDPADQLLREFGEHLGVGETYRKTPVGVFLGEPGDIAAPGYGWSCSPGAGRRGDCAGDGIDYVWGWFGWLGWAWERQCRAYGGAGECGDPRGRCCGAGAAAAIRGGARCDEAGLGVGARG